MARVRKLAFAIVDGTLILIDRVANQKPYCPWMSTACYVVSVGDGRGRLVFMPG